MDFLFLWYDLNLLDYLVVCDYENGNGEMIN